MEKPKETFIQRIAPGITVFLLSSLGISMASDWGDGVLLAVVSAICEQNNRLKPLIQPDESDSGEGKLGGLPPINR